MQLFALLPSPLAGGFVLSASLPADAEKPLPFEENTALAAPRSLKDPHPIVDFILRHAPVVP